MRDEQSWVPTKFTLRDGVLCASSDPAYVSVASRLNVQILAGKLQQLLQRFARGRLLDLGCGGVPLYLAYRSLVTSITCVDWVNSDHRLDHIDTAADLNEPLPLNSGDFETVVLTDVLEHIAQPEALLGEIRRVLSPGGMLLGSVPFLYRLHEEPHDHYRYTLHALTRLARRSGFAVELLDPYGAGTDVLFDVLGKLAQSSHWRFGDGWAARIQQLGLWARGTSLGRRINARHQSMPIGYVLAFRAI